jgi:biotin transport system substrate-specific component
MATRPRLLGRDTIRKMALVGLFLALFLVASNVIPPVLLIPNVPVTLQVLVVILAGALLGVPWGLAFLGMLFLMTLVGIPMMSGFQSGPAFFAGPTAGFVWGWIPLVVAAGLSRRVRRLNPLRDAAGFLVLALAGILADYACGAAWLAHVAARPFGAVMLSMAVFLPFDLGKAVLAWIIARRVRSAETKAWGG